MASGRFLLLSMWDCRISLHYTLSTSLCGWAPEAMSDLGDTWASAQNFLPFLFRTAGLWAHQHIQQDIQIYLSLYAYLHMHIYVCVGV